MSPATCRTEARVRDAPSGVCEWGRPGGRSERGRTCCAAGSCPAGSWIWAGAAAAAGPEAAVAGSACGSRPPSARCRRSVPASPGTAPAPLLKGTGWGRRGQRGRPHPAALGPGRPTLQRPPCSPPARTTRVRSYTSSSVSFSFFFFSFLSGARSSDSSSGCRMPVGELGLSGENAPRAAFPEVQRGGVPCPWGHSLRRRQMAATA